MASERNGPVASWPRQLWTEAYGTFALVFVAAGADTMALVSDGAVTVAARAVAPALVVAAMVYAVGDVSGAHFNPVVSLAFTLKRLFPARRLVPYWLAQVAGAIVAALVLRTMFGDAVAAGVTTPKVAPSIAVALEAILTLLLVTVVLGTADRARVVGPNAAIAVGATIALCGLIALPIDGASMNPARSLGPALVTGRLADVWIYLVGPTLGAVLAVVAVELVHGGSRDGPASRRAAQGEPGAE